MDTDPLQKTCGTIRIARWGNSLGLCIPKAVSEALGLRKGDLVEFLPTPEGFRIRKKLTYSLEVLIAGIHEENKHAEISWSKPMGAEAW